MIFSFDNQIAMKSETKKTNKFNMLSFNIALNIVLYLICQLAFFFAMMTCNCSLGYRIGITFVYSYMITDFYRGNKKIIKGYFIPQTQD
jgi:hypothetical protein